MSWTSDLKVLYHLAVKPVRGGSHAERMESFYAGQADAYDDFRKRLLQGRRELWGSIPVPPDGTWVDFGGGTGANLEYFGDSIQALRRVYVVDLASSLLEVASARARRAGWSQVSPVAADATTWTPPDGLVDVVTFSYSLTMIPDWFAAVDNARRILKPGGYLGVVDFYVSRKHAGEASRQHGVFTRWGWPAWFSLDNVFPSADHIPYLKRHFVVEHFEEGRARVPYLPLARVPYYRFVGRKAPENAA
ncbi:MAG TPA: class I SAM-dependent methyltransferase [Pirellulaceae bacterium]